MREIGEESLKIKQERHILELAKPLLKEVYGEFKVDENQKDRPDAAIILNKNNDKIGIEITCIDPRDVKEDFNSKEGEETTDEELKKVQFGDYSKNPAKKHSITFSNDYIFNGVFKKKEKYINYKNFDDYKEIIILVHSSYLGLLNNLFFKNYLKDWTQFLLAEKCFPFDKVIFVCQQTQDSFIIYDKNLSEINEPSQNKDYELGITYLITSILPPDKEVNLKCFFDNEPSIPKRSKTVIQKERKLKKKAEKKARKVNRSK